MNWWIIGGSVIGIIVLVLVHILFFSGMGKFRG